MSNFYEKRKKYLTESKGWVINPVLDKFLKDIRYTFCDIPFKSYLFWDKFTWDIVSWILLYPVHRGGVCLLSYPPHHIKPTPALSFSLYISTWLSKEIKFQRHCDVLHEFLRSAFRVSVGIDTKESREWISFSYFPFGLLFKLD